MPVTVIVGAQWGDEGKGKVTDFLAEEADVVARYQGGNNAGHTVIVGQQEYKLKLLPSGVVHERVKNVLGNGLVIDPAAFLDELKGVRARGLNPKLHVSDRATVILPLHRQLDGASEDKGAGIGTTRRGIGPAYVDKIGRTAVRVGDLLSPATLRARLEASVPEKLAILAYRGVKVDGDAKTIVDQLVKEYSAYGEAMAPMVTDTVALLHASLEANESIVLEGAQGTFLDIDHGTYPYVTSSNTTSGGACTGTGIPPTVIDSVFGIVKAYTTRVGGGPMVTELDHAQGAGKHMSEVGHEFGVVTGRRRRCGWLDMVLLRRSVQVNGMTSIALTKLDVLGGIGDLKVCVAYEIDGSETTRLPGDATALARAKPVYETMPGFEPFNKATISKASREGLAALPPEARRYVEAIEDALDVPIEIVGLGPAREQTLDRRVLG